MLGWSEEEDRRRFKEWANAMTRGDFQQAWDFDDAYSKHWPSAHQCWDGKVLRGRRVCVSCLHGLGDAVQMFQYAKLLKAAAAQVLYRLPQALVELASHFEAVDCVASLADPPPNEPDWCHLEMLELPYIFRTLPQELPLNTCYLDRSRMLRSRFAKRFMQTQSKLKVGLALQGGEWDAARWVPFEAIHQLLDNQGIRFDFLQGLPPAMPLAVRGRYSVLTGGLKELTGVIANLDLVIACDTLSAHVAGAVGTPCWLLLKADADWRWQNDERRTYWYPSTRLFRQASPGAWDAPLVQVRQMLSHTSLTKWLTAPPHRSHTVCEDERAQA